MIIYLFFIILYEWFNKNTSLWTTLVAEWVSENKFVLNVEKTESILFKSRRAACSDSQLGFSLKGSVIDQV